MPISQTILFSNRNGIPQFLIAFFTEQLAQQGNMPRSHRRVLPFLLTNRV
ncbi:conserved domain protein [delta proteobacterium NaphS2]|nr:conserved domain protein [delta proteobacterium NaphS2]